MCCVRCFAVGLLLSVLAAIGVCGAPRPAEPRKSSRGFAEPPGVYSFGFSLADSDPGYRIVVKHYLDDLDPRTRPEFPEKPETIRVSAARGEFEPAAFVIYATRELRSVAVEVSDLTGKGGTIPAREVEVCRVARTPQRRVYTAPISDTLIVGRFLPRWQPINIPAGELRETWLTFHVPPSAAPGDYQGRVTVSVGEHRQDLVVTLHVYPFELRESAAKSHASYYSQPFPKMSDAEIRRDLSDLRLHGVRHLVWGTGVDYAPDPTNNKAFRPDFSDVRRMLNLAKAEGFRGTMVFGTRFETLARRMGFADVMRRGEATATSPARGKPIDAPSGESLDGPGGAEFRQIAAVAMQEFLQLQTEYPQFRLFATHLDEVFNEGRLPLYIRLTKIGQQAPGVKFYITFNTLAPVHDEMRRQIDPYVDLRCHHGYSFEWWLARGHSIAEYAAELKASGDEAWFYHNARGGYCTAQWARIINGIYLWASPFSAHCPWTYRSASGNPFDDSDEQGMDFGFAFPDPDDPSRLVSTRLWEGMREGFDDVRYMATLTDLIRVRRTSKPREVAEAQAFLDGVIERIRNLKITRAKDSGPAARGPARFQVNLDTGAVTCELRTGTVMEAPVIYALMQRYPGDQLQTLRAQIAEHILRLSAE